MKLKKTIKTKKPDTGVLKIAVFILLAMLLLVLLSAAGFLMDSFFRAPEVAGNDENSSVTDSAGASIDFSRREGVYTFLLLGRDADAANTDAVMVASFDSTSGKLGIVQIPRDTYIMCNGSPAHINVVYARLYYAAADRGEKDSRAAALDDFCSLMSDTLGIPVDYYAMVYLDGFVRIIDRIGGVTVNVPCDMDYDDPEQDLHIHLKAGEQLLDGAACEQFVRFRSGYALADIGRIDAQKIFMSALLTQLPGKLTVSNIPLIASDLLENTVTSLTLQNCIYFAGRAGSVSSDSISMATLPGQAVYTGAGGWYYAVNREAAARLTDSLLSPYGAGISPGMFDLRLRLTDLDDDTINSIYTAPGKDFAVYSAGDINSDGIDIIPK